MATGTAEPVQSPAVDDGQWKDVVNLPPPDLKALTHGGSGDGQWKDIPASSAAPTASAQASPKPASTTPATLPPPPVNTTWMDRPMSDMQPHEKAAYKAALVAPSEGQAKLETEGPLERYKEVEIPAEAAGRMAKELETMGIKDPAMRAAISTKAFTLLRKQEDRDMTADELVAAGITTDNDNQPIVKGSGEMYKVPMNGLGESQGVYHRAPLPSEMVQGWTMQNGTLQGGIFNKRTGQTQALYNAIPPAGLPHITEGQVFLWNANTGQFEPYFRTTQRGLNVPIAGQGTPSGPTSPNAPASTGGTAPTPTALTTPTAIQGAPPTNGLITDELIKFIQDQNKGQNKGAGLSRQDTISALQGSGYKMPGAAPSAATPLSPPLGSIPPLQPHAAALSPGQVPAAQSNQVRQALVPTREIGTTFFSGPETPYRETIENFADIADNPEMAKKVGSVANLIINGLQKGGDQGANVSASFGGVGLSLGAFGNWLANATGLPGLQSQAQVNTIYDAYKSLPEREQRAVKSIIAAYSVMPGMRAATKGSALEFYVSKLENEIATFGNTTSRQQYYENMSIVARELNNIYKSIGMGDTEGQQYAVKDKMYSYLSRLTPDEIKNFKARVGVNKSTGDVVALRNGKWVHP